MSARINRTIQALLQGRWRVLLTMATGTGKTVSLRVLAETFSSIGVPVFMADVKGDLSGLVQPGGENPKVVERARQLGLALQGVFKATDGIVDTDTTVESDAPREVLVVDRPRAARLGVAAQTGCTRGQMHVLRKLRHRRTRRHQIKPGLHRV